MNFENLRLITQKQLLKKHKIDLEHKLKNLENNLTSDENRKFYNHYKNERETIYDHIAEGLKKGANVNGISMMRNPQSFFQTLKKSDTFKTESGNLLLKIKK